MIFLSNQNVPVACVPTGVKHLHHAALAFDVGVYFEANGHGTVVFAQEAERRIREEAGKNNEAAKRMADVIDVINQVLIKIKFSLSCYGINPKK